MHFRRVLILPTNNPSKSATNNPPKSATNNPPKSAIDGDLPKSAIDGDLPKSAIDGDLPKSAIDGDYPFIEHLGDYLIIINSKYNRYECKECGYVACFFIFVIRDGLFKGLYKDQCWELKSYKRPDISAYYLYTYYYCIFILPELGNVYFTNKGMYYFDQKIIHVYNFTCTLEDGTLARCFDTKSGAVTAYNTNGEEVKCYILKETDANTFEDDKYRVVLKNSSYIFINKSSGKYTKAAAVADTTE